MPDKILVVDDEAESLRLIGLTLHRQGFEVIPATTGQQALEKATAMMPDLIVLDVMMPGMDGIEVCRRIKSTPALKQIPVIMFTAKAMVDDKVAGFEAGADDYLTKPVHPNELVARVKTLLARHQSTAVGSIGGQHMAIGFIGAKGGVGLTTLALNLGIAFQRKGPTIVAELRPGQGNLSTLSGVDRTAGLTNLLSRQPNELNAQLVSGELAAHSSGLRLLMSSNVAREAQTQLSPDSLSAAIKVMSSISRTTLIDMGPALTRTNLRLLRDLNLVVVVAEPAKTALLLARDLIKEIKAGGQPASVNLVLVNRTSSNIPASLQEVEQVVGYEVLTLLSAAPELMFQAAAASQPLLLAQPNAPLSIQISKLADDLDARLLALQQAAKGVPNNPIGTASSGSVNGPSSPSTGSVR